MVYIQIKVHPEMNVLETYQENMNLTSGTTPLMLTTPPGVTADSQHNGSSNCSVRDSAEPSPLQIAMAALELVLMVLICFGNGMVIAAFYRARRLRTRTNYFIMNLSIADFCVGLLMPFHAMLFFYPDLLQTLSVCVFRYSSLMTMLGVSVFCLLAMTYDRYSAITKPLHYQSDIMSTRRIVITCCVVWFVPILGLFMVPFLWNERELFFSKCKCDFSLVLKSEYIRYMILPGFLVCTVIVLFFYARIFLVARRHLENIRKLEAQLQAQKKFRKNFKLTMTAAIVLGVFFVSWLPFMLTVAVQEYSNVQTDEILLARTWTTLIAVLNSAWNPIIYAMRLRGFKAEFKSILKIKWTSSDYSSTFRKHVKQMQLHRKRSQSLNSKRSDNSEDVIKVNQPHMLTHSAHIILQITGINTQAETKQRLCDNRQEGDKPEHEQILKSDNGIINQCCQMEQGRSQNQTKGSADCATEMCLVLAEIRTPEVTHDSDVELDAKPSHTPGETLTAGFEHFDEVYL